MNILLGTSTYTADIQAVFFRNLTERHCKGQSKIDHLSTLIASDMKHVSSFLPNAKTNHCKLSEA